MRYATIVICSLLLSAATGQGLSGSFAATLEGRTYSLSLTPAGGARLAGTLTSSAGLSLRLEGNIVDDEDAGGACYQGEAVAGYFELSREGNQLAFLFTPADAEGMPDLTVPLAFRLWTGRSGLPTGAGCGASLRTSLALVGMLVGAGYLVSIPTQWQLANVVLITLYTALVGASALLTTAIWRRRAP